jgi:Ca-activated chloride channel family protein
LLLVLTWPKPALAFDWQELWQTRDQQASRVFAAGDPAKAAESFDNPAWKAAAQYKAGQYEEAAKTLRSQESADARYNLGNALAKQGHYPEAIAAYDQALKRDPKHGDARFNKELVEKALKDQQKQQDPQDKKSGQNKEQHDDKDKQSQQNQDQQKGGQEDRQQQEQKDKPGEKPEEQKGRQDQKQDQGQSQQNEPAEEQQHDEAKENTQADQQRQPEQQGEEKQAQMDAQEHKSEEQQANEQWLRRIPDDPGGLLRRKFLYQYQQRQRSER